MKISKKLKQQIENIEFNYRLDFNIIAEMDLKIQLKDNLFSIDEIITDLEKLKELIEDELSKENNLK
jgi:hypothetical protein